jgi:hypothetical protein
MKVLGHEYRNMTEHNQQEDCFKIMNTVVLGDIKTSCFSCSS